jgi:hypothetical protein
MAISGRNIVVTPPMTPAFDPQPQHWEIRCREKQATVRCGDRVINFYFSAFDVNREFFAFGGYNSGSIELTAYTPSGARLSSRGWTVEGLNIECEVLSQQFAMNDLARTEICLTPDRGSLAWEAEPPIYRFTVTPQTRNPQSPQRLYSMVDCEPEIVEISGNSFDYSFGNSFDNFDESLKMIAPKPARMSELPRRDLLRQSPNLRHSSLRLE